MQEDARALRIFSFGGGIQSVAALVLAAQGKINYHCFVFANVGDDSENPKTLRYILEVAVPFAQKHGLVIWETGRPGPTLYQKVTRAGNRFAGIPMRLSNGKPGRRACTSDYKVQVLDTWLLEVGGIREHLAWERALTFREMKRAKQEGTPCSYQAAKNTVIRSRQTFRPLAIVGMGISLDEVTRARTLAPLHWKALDYPLIRLRLTRQDCIAIIHDAGLPLPPKSACWFCPYRTLAGWLEMQEEQPFHFELACQLEENFNQGRRSKMWLTNKGRPLREAIRVYSVTKQPETRANAEEHLAFCESGHCWN